MIWHEERLPLPFTTVILDFFLMHLVGPLALVVMITAGFFSFEYFIDGLVATIYRAPRWPEQLLLSGLIGSGYFMVWNPPGFMMQVGGQDGFLINQSVRLYITCAGNGSWGLHFPC
jgi:hypothetical protein